MRRRVLLLSSVAALVAFAGCRHHCHKKDGSCGPGPGPLPPGVRGGPDMLPPPNVPTIPGPSVPPPAPPSNYLAPPVAPKSGGSETLFPDPLPGGPSSRPAMSGVLGAPVKSPTAEPPKAPAPGLSGYTKVKDGLYAGGKPTLDGFDSLKAARVRTVVYLHAAGADVAAVRDMASTRDLTVVAIETTPETLADASKQFDRVAADRTARPVYVFADDAPRAGAVWYLHFRNADAGDDVARLRAKALGLNDQGDEGRAFALAIQRVLETK
ncbi:protein-tyrosine phosphatase family protein [Frigoriglobus tundricola]|uniref:Uncharacterized protein n=1 Tax=Frigoriglobus tundricola TaxID=2774151 RepID=A0A6M5YQJ5_9BACT|nr:hypothetical protein [Frigoriglobus tundricola]QJW95636.1 hypothetical protein FTUN_3187 [Frigoriglobus tundricola]